jgi:outer membrane protein assembly factor BamB
MKWRGLIVVTIVALAVVAGAYFIGLIPTRPTGTCDANLASMIQLPNVSGRIDHMAYDPGLKRLFVAALGNNSVVVVNFTSGRIERALRGFSQPQGVAYISSKDQVYVSNGGTGIVNVLDAKSLTSIANISLASDADNMRYDSSSNRVYVGYGQGGVAVVDATTRAIAGTITLPGHPEGFQVDTGSGMVFVNVPTSGYIAVASTATYTVSQRWPLSNSTGNYPMALDQSHGRLFVGTRSPAQLLVIDTGNGKTIATMNVPTDPDDIYYDGANGCIFVSSGSGYLTVVREEDPSHYSVIREIATSANARTLLLVPERGLLIVAAPASQNSQAELLVYTMHSIA